jgi:diguanylate cyclase (GGDEF)-like protein
MLSHFGRLVARFGHARIRYVLIGGGLLLGLTLAVAIAVIIFLQRQPVVDDAVRELRNDALLLAEEEDRLLQSIDAVQSDLIQAMRDAGIDTPEAFQRDMGTEGAYRNLHTRIAGLPQVASLSLYDNQAALLNVSSVWPPPPGNDVDRSLFDALTADKSARPFVSLPWRSKVTGQWAIVLGRRFDAPDGRLIGFVLGSIQVSYFEQYYAHLPLTGGASYSMFLRDGTLIARYPRTNPAIDAIGTTYINTENFGSILRAVDNGVVRMVSSLDGNDRLVVPHALPHFPLLIAVGDTAESILASWRAQSRILMLIGMFMEGVLAVMVLLSVRHLHGYELLQEAEIGQERARVELALAAEREQAARALQAQERLFDAALQNMQQGLLMFSHARELLVVNRRFYELFGMPCDSLAQGMSYDELTARVGDLGNVAADDIDGIREVRRMLLAQNKQALVTWELSDGRAFNVTHEPMEGGWLATLEEVTELRKAEERLVHLAHHDGLTGLPNRVLFRDKLAEALAFAKRGWGLALLFLNLDRFKAVNDALGHPIGDMLLQRVAERLCGAIRETDVVARLGGDEFAIVQCAITQPGDAMSYATRLLALFSDPFDVAGHRIVISTSIGIALSPQDGVDADQLLRDADLALYRAKSDGRGIFRLFHAEMDQQMQRRHQLELDLRQAIQKNQLEVFYQPQIDMTKRAVTSVEALVRWRHPDRGLISPTQFIPVAEEIGLIVPIGEWVLRTACTAIMAQPGALRVAVNLSAAQFASQDLVAIIRRALHDSGLPASRLELEITESIMLTDTTATLATLYQLRDLGVHIALDDFGTGYSSLSYLRRFPFDRIKIDQSFVREMSVERDCYAIIRAITGLSRELGMTTTAEGVESQEQLAMLTAAGCTDIQGYLFSRAVPLNEIERACATIAGMLRKSVHYPLNEAAA